MEPTSHTTKKSHQSSHESGASSFKDALAMQQYYFEQSLANRQLWSKQLADEQEASIKAAAERTAASAAEINQILRGKNETIPKEPNLESNFPELMTHPRSLSWNISRSRTSLSPMVHSCFNNQNTYDDCKEHYRSGYVHNADCPDDRISLHSYRGRSSSKERVCSNYCRSRSNSKERKHSNYHRSRSRSNSSRERRYSLNHRSRSNNRERGLSYCQSRSRSRERGGSHYCRSRSNSRERRLSYSSSRSRSKERINSRNRSAKKKKSSSEFQTSRDRNRNPKNDSGLHTPREHKTESSDYRGAMGHSICGSPINDASINLSPQHHGVMNNQDAEPSGNLSNLEIPLSSPNQGHRICGSPISDASINLSPQHHSVITNQDAEPSGNLSNLEIPLSTPNRGHLVKNNNTDHEAGIRKETIYDGSGPVGENKPGSTLDAEVPLNECPEHDCTDVARYSLTHSPVGSRPGFSLDAEKPLNEYPKYDCSDLPGNSLTPGGLNNEAYNDDDDDDGDGDEQVSSGQVTNEYSSRRIRRKTGLLREWRIWMQKKLKAKKEIVKQT